MENSQQIVRPEEALGIALQLAVQEAFAVSNDVRQELEDTVIQGPRELQTRRITEMRAQQIPGLRSSVAEAFCSGDSVKIELAMDRANIHAKNRIVARTARRAIQAFMAEDIKRKPGSKQCGNSTISLQKGRLVNL